MLAVQWFRARRAAKSNPRKNPLQCRFDGAADIGRADTLDITRPRRLRPLSLKPQVLLLDEPAAGLTTAQGHALFDQLTALAGDTSVLFIEHDMALVFGYAQRVTVLGGGALLAQGTPDQIRADPVVRKAYLGH